ncbi:Uncharacterised protein [Mycobacteroides abscessus subsp. abscessus]|nr:Uncharacterised protein [Mycobacteroides abscessus subsp. abscessus]
MPVISMPTYPWWNRSIALRLPTVNPFSGSLSLNSGNISTLRSAVIQCGG